jgi:glycosyltransferase involved in cell wall biosynthesis
MVRSKGRIMSGNSAFRSDPEIPVILYITNQVPFCLDSGGQRREFELLRRAIGHYTVHLLVIHPPSGAGVEVVERGNGLSENLASLHIVPTTKWVGDTSTPARIREHYSSHAIDLTRSLIQDLQPDLIHVEGYYLMYVLPQGLDVPVVLGEENVEYHLDEQRAQASDKYSMEAAGHAKLREQESWKTASVICVATKDDAQTILDAIPTAKVVVVPNASNHFVSKPRVSARSPGDSPIIGFLGNYRWFPTLDAAIVLARDIWPAIRQERPDASLWLIGQGGKETLTSEFFRQAGIVITGWVEDVVSTLQELDLFICPLRIGGGSKFKISDALISGCAIVSTPIGVQGFPKAAVDAIRVVESIDDFALAVLSLLREDEAREELEYLATKAAGSLDRWEDAGARLMDGWNTAMRGARCV